MASWHRDSVAAWQRLWPTPANHCPYCGAVIHTQAKACGAHRDLLKHDPQAKR